MRRRLATPQAEDMTDDDGSVRALHQAVGMARADLGDAHPTTVRLRARLTRRLIELGRDADAAGLEARTLDGLGRGKEADR